MQEGYKLKPELVQIAKRIIVQLGNGIGTVAALVRESVAALGNPTAQEVIDDIEAKHPKCRRKKIIYNLIQGVKRDRTLIKDENDRYRINGLDPVKRDLPVREFVWRYLKARKKAAAVHELYAACRLVREKMTWDTFKNSIYRCQEVGKVVIRNARTEFLIVHVDYLDTIAPPPKPQPVKPPEEDTRNQREKDWASFRANMGINTLGEESNMYHYTRETVAA